jgi:hypothetical protein
LPGRISQKEPHNHRDTEPNCQDRHDVSFRTGCKSSRPHCKYTPRSVGRRYRGSAGRRRPRPRNRVSPREQLPRATMLPTVALRSASAEMRNWSQVDHLRPQDGGAAPRPSRAGGSRSAGPFP